MKESFAPALICIQGHRDYLKILRPLSTNHDPPGSAKHFHLTQAFDNDLESCNIEEDDDVSSGPLVSVLQGNIQSLIFIQRLPSTILLPSKPSYQ